MGDSVASSDHVSDVAPGYDSWRGGGGLTPHGYYFDSLAEIDRLVVQEVVLRQPRHNYSTTVCLTSIPLLICYICFSRVYFRVVTTGIFLLLQNGILLFRSAYARNQSK